MKNKVISCLTSGRLVPLPAGIAADVNTITPTPLGGRIMRKFAIVLTSITSLGVAASAQAQGPSVNDAAAYVALSATPVGAMTPVVTSAMLGRIAKGYTVSGQYGHLSDNGAGFNSFGAAISMPV